MSLTSCGRYSDANWTRVAFDGRGLLHALARIAGTPLHYRWLVTPQPAAPGAPEPICSLPVVGDTTLEDAVFYAAVGTVATLGLVPWATAGLFGSLHALHQRARNVSRAGAVGEARQGLIEAADEVL